jgi:hypothetical protein
VSLEPVRDPAVALVLVAGEVVVVAGIDGQLVGAAELLEAQGEPQAVGGLDAAVRAAVEQQERHAELLRPLQGRAPGEDRRPVALEIGPQLGGERAVDPGVLLHQGAEVGEGPDGRRRARRKAVADRLEDHHAAP